MIFKPSTIYLFGEIESEVTRNFIMALHQVEDPGPIVVALNSLGGSDSDGWAIYDAIRMVKQDVHVVVIGAAYSIAALILQAGDRRLMTRHARMMVHYGTWSLGDVDVKSVELQREARESAAADDLYVAALSEASGHVYKTVNEWCAEDRYFSAREAVKWGLADSVVG